MAVWRRTGDNRIFDPFAFDPFWDFPSFPSFPSSLWDEVGPSRRLSSRDASAVVNTQVDWKETEGGHIFKVDLPGLNKKEVKVEVEDNRVLKISGERTREETNKTDTWHRVERSHGSFVRRFRLPSSANAEEIKASMENGVLTVQVPKIPQPKPVVKSIDISS